MDKIRSNNRMNHVTVNSGSDINNRSANTIFDIADEIDLGTASITVPCRCGLNFITSLY